MLLAEISLGDVFLSVLWFAGLFLWIALAIMIFSDVFSDHGLSGWGKAGWTIFIVILPLLGVLIYLIARGNSMRERQLNRASMMLVPVITSDAARAGMATRTTRSCTAATSLTTRVSRSPRRLPMSVVRLSLS